MKFFEDLFLWFVFISPGNAPEIALGFPPGMPAMILPENGCCGTSMDFSHGFLQEFPSILPRFSQGFLQKSYTNAHWDSYRSSLCEFYKDFSNDFPEIPFGGASSRIPAAISSGTPLRIHPRILLGLPLESLAKFS